MKRSDFIEKPLYVVFALAVVPLIVLSCSSHNNGADHNGTIGAFASILPEAYLVQRVGGEYVKTSVLVQPGQSPETFEPTPQQMAELSDADVLFGIGVPFEDALFAKIKSSMPGVTIVRADQGIAKIPMESSRLRDALSGATGAPDPHIWLDPKRALQISETIHDALIKIEPVHKDAFDANFIKLKNDLENIDSLIAEKLRPYRGRSFYVMHPAFGYFAEEYELHQKSIEIEGKEPSARELADLIKEMISEHVKTIFVEKQFSTAMADRLATELGAKVVMIDPLAYQYVDNLMSIADAIAGALGGQR